MLHRIVSHPRPIRFLCSRVCLRLRVSLPWQVTFCRAPLVQVWLTANPIAHAAWLRVVEPEEVAVFKDCIQTDSVVCDIGANIGTHTLLAAALAGQGTVVACEPGARTYRALVRNVASAGCAHVHTYEVAVTDSTEPTFLIQPGRSDEQASVTTAGAQAQAVTSRRLDDIMQEQGLTHVDFLKIDVEGAELPVLRSLGSNIADVQMVYFEFVPSSYQAFGYTAHDLQRFLHQAGYRLYQPQVANDGQVTYLPLPQLDEQMITAKNILAARQQPVRCITSDSLT